MNTPENYDGKKCLSFEDVIQMYAFEGLKRQSDEFLLYDYFLCFHQGGGQWDRKSNMIAQAILGEQQRRNIDRLIAHVSDLKLVAGMQMQVMQATKDESAVLTKETIVLRKYTSSVKNLTWAIVALTVVLAAIAVWDEVEKNNKKEPGVLNTWQNTVFKRDVYTVAPPTANTNIDTPNTNQNLIAYQWFNTNINRETPRTLAHQYIDDIGTNVFVVAKIKSYQTNQIGFIYSALQSNKIPVRYIDNMTDVKIVINVTNAAAAKRLIANLGATVQ